MQWGTTTSFTTITFPLSFKSAPSIILVSTTQSSSHHAWNAGYRTVTKTSFYCENEVTGCYTAIWK